MANLEEQLNNLEQKFNDLEANFYKGHFSNLDVFNGKVQVRGGIIGQVMTAVPTYTGTLGETVWVSDGSTTKKICTWMASTWQCQDYGISDTGIANVVEDTTPQLGGNLDTNGKSITSEGGYILRDTITKTLSDNVDTNILSVQLSQAGACTITVRYIHSVTPNDTYNACEVGERVTTFSCDASTQSINRADDQYLYEVENGGATTTTVWTETMATNNKITLSLLVNNNISASEKFYAEVVIISTAPFTYTEL